MHATKKHLTAVQIANTIADSELSSLGNVVRKAAKGALIIKGAGDGLAIVASTAKRDSRRPSNGPTAVAKKRRKGSKR